MTEFKKIYKKDILALLDDEAFWKNDFLAISKHRLYSHYKNPVCDDNDIVLLLAYINDDLVGYMGSFTDKITLNGNTTKISWLSTWWVHPKTKGSGIGRQILDEMFLINNGKIGISQFTPSAKRVYDKSGYFVNLKESTGMKAVLRSNLTFVIPTLYPFAKKADTFLNLTDNFINIFINLKLKIQEKTIKSKLKNIEIEYLTFLDKETKDLILKFNSNHISIKNNDFFEWLKAYQWVQESPLLSLTDKHKYAFSIYDNSFNIYFLKIKKNNTCIGFLVIQKRNNVSKLLFSYFEKPNAPIITNIIKLTLIKQNSREFICYDESICNELKKSYLFLYKTKKIKNSIISKQFGVNDFNDIVMNFGDGDCCFA